MLSIIICDDDQTINHQLLPIIQQYLEQKKIPAAIQQYTDAKKLLEDMPLFDIMFLDVEMPEQNGIEVAKAFRQAVKLGTDYLSYQLCTVCPDGIFCASFWISDKAD